MKKRILPIVLVLLLSCLTLCACFGLGGTKTTKTTQTDYDVIIYDVEGVKYYQNDFVTSTGTYTKPRTEPQKTGYTFEGWYLDENKTTPLVVGQKVSGTTVRIYAKWEVAKVQVLVVDEVNGNNVFKIDYGTKFRPATPAKPDGYSFGGYYTDEDRTEAYDTDTLVKDELTLYVKWEGEMNKITYTLYGGEFIVANPPLEYKSGATVLLPTVEKSGYTFKGWYVNEAFTGEPVTKIEDTYGDKTFYAKYICHLATMTEIDGISEKDGSTYVFGTDHSAHTVQIADYFAFAENATVVLLDEDENVVTDGVVSFTANNKIDGTVVEKNFTVVVTSESEITTKRYALTIRQYDASLVNVTYFMDGGLLLTDTVNVGGIITEKVTDPGDKEGYTFAYWQEDGKTGAYVFGTIAVPDGDIKLNAVFVPTDYSISYKLGTAINNEDNPTSYTIKDAIVLKNPIVREGYTFDGWYKDPSYENKITTVGGTTGTLTLYARYTKAYDWNFTYDGDKYVVTADEYPYLLDYLAFCRETSAKVYIQSGYASTREGFLTTAKGDVTVGHSLSVSYTHAGDTATVNITMSNYAEAYPENKTSGGTYTQVPFVAMVTAETGLPVDYDFPVDHIKQTIPVQNSEQLYYTLENGYRPDCEADSTAEELYAEMKSILRSILDEGMTEKEICVAIAQYLVKTIEYDNDVLTLFMAAKTQEEQKVLSDYRSFYLEGAILDGVAVCDGISKAYACLARIMGIEALRVTGTLTSDKGKVNHAWNKVKIDLDGDGTREWTVVDCTSANTEMTGTKLGSVEFMNYLYLFATDDFLTTERGYEYNDKWDGLYVTNTPYNVYDAFEYKTGATYKVETQSELNAIMRAYKTKFDAEIGAGLSLSIYMPKSLGMTAGKISSNLWTAMSEAGFTVDQYNTMTSWSVVNVGDSDVVITFFVQK